MKKILIIILTIIITLIPQINANNEDKYQIIKNEININSNNNELLIEENYIILNQKNNDDYEYIDFWINENAYEINLFIENELGDINFIGNNIYRLNTTSYNISKNDTIEITLNYLLNTNIETFEKKFLYNINQIDIQFNGLKIFYAHNIKNETYIELSLYTPTEAPISIYIFIAIFLIVLLILTMFYYIYKSQKSSKNKNINVESKELLSTKKTLIMLILKQLEKDHRSKKISDDTYNKLKEYYKQDAVESMKKLEDMESEII